MEEHSQKPKQCEACNILACIPRQPCSRSVSPAFEVMALSEQAFYLDWVMDKAYVRCLMQGMNSSLVRLFEYSNIPLFDAMNIDISLMRPLNVTTDPCSRIISSDRLFASLVVAIPVGGKIDGSKWRRVREGEKMKIHSSFSELAQHMQQRLRQMSKSTGLAVGEINVIDFQRELFPRSSPSEKPLLVNDAVVLADGSIWKPLVDFDRFAISCSEFGELRWTPLFKQSIHTADTGDMMKHPQQMEKLKRIQEKMNTPKVIEEDDVDMCETDDTFDLAKTLTPLQLTTPICQNCGWNTSKAVFVPFDAEDTPLFVK
jgi:hypothetical protein